MQLRVAVSSDALGEEEVDEVVHSFSDLDRISANCARVIKQFIRDTPVRASLHRANFLVTAQWIEAEKNTHTQTPDVLVDQPRPKRKRPAAKKRR
jgi:hypothetical protein